MSSNFVTVQKSTQVKIENERGPPITGYRKLSVEMADEPHQDVAAPRDRKQLENAQYKIRQKARLSKDGLWNVVNMLEDTFFVHSLYMDKDELIVCCFNNHLAEIFCQVLASKDLPPQCLSYDTTFKLGDFYLSFLTFRETELTRQPAIPLIFFIHERKFEQQCVNRS